MTRSPTKHTPGPWRVKHNTKLEWAGVLTQKGDIVADVDLDGQDFRDPEQALDDARLIAAAPDMLEACEMLAEAQRRADVGEHDGFGCYVDAVDKARAAISKARGDQ